jgi:probable HAF family extracellular repeat protein
MPAIAKNLSNVQHFTVRRTALALAIAASLPVQAQVIGPAPAPALPDNGALPTSVVSTTADAEFRSSGTPADSSAYFRSASGSSKPVSADGRVVISASDYVDSNNGYTRGAYRWTASGGYESLGSLGGNRSFAYGISADGSTIVGESRNQSGDSRAFRWTAAGGMVSLGVLSGGAESYATAVASDGAVVVGTSDTANGDEAFRWTPAGGMVSLGHLGGGYSEANGVSADGSTVVGVSYTENEGQRAFRWTASGGMVNLGVLEGGNYSYARGASKTGDVVFGQANTASDNDQAFRWTQAGGMVSLGHLGGGNSYANAMNADGTVLVGGSNVADSGSNHAFRWTLAGGMADLGILDGGNFSVATDLSADGAVVVGFSNTSQKGYQAFRWTQASGMQSVPDWLKANGVTVAEGWYLADGGEVYTNATGNVVVGSGRNPDGRGEIWLARVGPYGSGAVTLAEVQQSLAQTSVAGQSAVTATNTVLNGAQSRPLDRRVEAGKKTFWVAGDWGTDDHGERSGSLGLAELGLGYNLGPVQINGTLGQTWTRQNTNLNGLVKTKGTYLSAEALVPLTGQWWATFTATGHQGQADMRRAYLNAGTRDTSVGDTDMDTWALRARAEWDKGLRWGAIEASPYVDLSYAETQMDGYTEVGGGFPARFDARKEKSTELRLGVNLARPLSNMTLFGTAELVHRFESHGARSSGEMLGLFAFDLEGVRNQQTWLRTGLGLSSMVAGGTATATINLTTKGEAPSAWLGVRWQIAF